MGLSETIVAAVIGASATLSAAGFQLMKARSQSTVRPRRSALRAALTLVALVVASAVGGYAYSELRADDARQDIARLRAEIGSQLQALAIADEKRAETMQAAPPVVSSEALVQLAPCVRNGAEGDGPTPLCDPASATPVTLCTQIPATAERLGSDRYSRPLDGAGDWQSHTNETADQTVDVAFVDASPTYAAAAGLVPVCVNVSNEDPVHARIARIVVRYRAQPVPPQPAVASR